MYSVQNVHGSLEAAIPLEVGKTTVYVRTNIHKYVPPADADPNMPMPDNMYEWDEVQYTKDEYIAKMIEKDNQNESNVMYVAMMTGVDMTPAGE